MEETSGEEDFRLLQFHIWLAGRTHSGLIQEVPVYVPCGSAG